jgi:hypothetical protein
MHVFDAAQEAVERGGEDDDGDVGAAAAKEGGGFGAELAFAEMIVEDGDVDGVEELGGLFDGGDGDAVVAVPAEDGGSEMEIDGVVVEQEDTYAVRGEASDGGAVGEVVGRLNHDPSLHTYLLSTTKVISWMVIFV